MRDPFHEEESGRLLMMLVTTKIRPDGSLAYDYREVQVPKDAFEVEYRNGLVIPMEFLESLTDGH